MKWFVIGIIITTILILSVDFKRCLATREEEYWREGYSTPLLIGKVVMSQYHEAGTSTRTVCDQYEQ